MSNQIIEQVFDVSLLFSRFGGIRGGVISTLKNQAQRDNQVQIRSHIQITFCIYFACEVNFCKQFLINNSLTVISPDTIKV